MSSRRASKPSPPETSGPARVLVFTGKGGVGKTTLAAASAARAAKLGHRTLVVSTDPAHSLGDVFDRTIGAEPTELATNLWGQHIDARLRLEQSWAELRVWLGELFRWAGVSAIEAAELTLPPGVEELVALADLHRWLDGERFDVVVVDCAPTAETVRLLSLPDVATWWMDRLFGPARQMTRLVSPVVRQFTDLPVAPDDVFAAVERLHTQLSSVRRWLTDPDLTSVRLVLTAEKMVVAEARRTFTYLSLFGYRVDAVVANRLLPDEITDPWFDHWRSMETEQLDVVATSFGELPILRAQLAPTEPIGARDLERLARQVYGRRDPVPVFHRTPALTVRRTDDGWVLSVELGAADRHEVALTRRRDELHITVGPYRRAVLIPDALRSAAVSGAAVSEGRLEVEFRGP